ncbi:hypothetical protein PGN42_10415 [Klebsiella aerogenes]
MTNNQLTKEWLQQTIAELESVRDEIPFGIDTNSELELAAFKLALAAMDSEPVAEITEDLGRLFVKIHSPTILRAGDKLYRHAQPAPVVPEEMPCGGAADDYHDGYQDGWNACRAAMIAAAPQEVK